MKNIFIIFFKSLNEKVLFHVWKSDEFMILETEILNKFYLTSEIHGSIVFSRKLHPSPP